MPALIRRALGLASVLILLIAALASFPAGAQTPAADQTELRVAVRPLEDGRLEFALLHDGERLLPDLRYLTPALAQSRSERWLRSSPITIALPDPDDPDQTIEREVRIAVRPLPDGRAEFGLAIDGERILPRARYLTPGLAQSRQGDWLRSSAVQPPAPAEPEPEPVEEPEPPGDDGEDGGDGDEPDQPEAAPLAFDAPAAAFEFTAGSEIEPVVLPAATGGEGEIAYSLSAIPDLSFDAPSRTLSGTPPAAGQYNGTYSATDAAGNRAEIAVAITVHAAGTAPRFRAAAADIELETGQELAPVALPDADGEDLAYSLAPLPPGLAFDPATRQLSGIPSEAGEYVLAYVVRNPRGGTDQQTFTVTVRAPNSVPVFSGSVADPEYAVGDQVSLALPAATGGNGALEYSLSGSVPGLTFNKSSRVLSGAPTAAGSYTLTLTVRDADARILDDTDSLVFTVRITSPRIIITGGSAPPPRPNLRPSFSARVDDQTFERGDPALLRLPFADGGDGALRYSLSPAIPGMTFDPVRRQLSGSPSVEGDIDVTYTVSDADGDSASLRFTISVIVTDTPPRFSPRPADIDALKTVANGVNALRDPARSMLVITHYQRLLDYIAPDRVHVLAHGRIVKSGGGELALELEKEGYGALTAAEAA